MKQDELRDFLTVVRKPGCVFIDMDGTELHLDKNALLEDLENWIDDDEDLLFTYKLRPWEGRTNIILLSITES